MKDLRHSQAGVACRYDALRAENQEIRLIEIYPMDKDDLEVHAPLVRCCLKHASLNDAPRYTALSYAWGDPTATRPILVDGEQVQVSANLESVLRLQATELSRTLKPSLALWVDAVCIDQHNEVEKTQQVAQMSKVYATAEKTLIWLGHASADSELAFDILQKLALMAKRIKPEIKSWSWFPFAENPSDPHVVVIQDGLKSTLVELCRENSSGLAAITSLFQRSWFRRVWVIQERVLSPHCVIYCGKKHMSWKRFYRAFWYLCGIRDYLNIVGSGTPGRWDSSATANVLTAALDRVTPVAFTRPRSSLLTHLYLLSRMAATAQLQASDPRDYIFALLGLVDPQSTPQIHADYSKNWSTVQMEVAKTCLVSYGPSLLSFVGLYSTASPPDLPARSVPSWAPDWSSEYLPQPLIIPSIFVSRGQGKLNTYSAAAGSSQNLAGAFSTDHQLSLHAAFVDDVLKLGNPLPEVDDTADDITRVSTLALWLQELDDFLPHTNDVYPTPLDMREALWRTPIIDRAFAYNWEAGRATSQTFCAYQALRAGRVSEGVKYASIATVKLHRRRPFVSSRGYFGLGPLGMSTGDSVWIVPGSDVPFVFRRSENGTFTVVGEAYVHGIMDGEFVKTPTETQRLKLV